MVILNPRETLLCAVVFYLLGMNLTATPMVLVQCVSFLFLIEALIEQIRDRETFVWEKCLWGFSACWAAFVVVSRNLCGRVASIEWLTTFFACTIAVLMFLSMSIYLVLHQRGKWVSNLSFEKTVQLCIGNHTTMILLMLACIQ